MKITVKKPEPVPPTITIELTVDELRTLKDRMGSADGFALNKKYNVDSFDMFNTIAKAIEKATA